MSLGYLAIGTQQLSLPAAEEPGYPWDERVPPPGRDATLLAVVPIPGTGTSLAIVGYAIRTSDEPEPVAHESNLVAEPASGLLIDRVQRRVWADGAEITLTFQEFELLAFLSAHPATVFSRADLLARVWRFPAVPDRGNVRSDSRTVDVHVSRLRRKLGPVHGPCLVTEHRAGYQFRPLTM